MATSYQSELELELEDELGGLGEFENPEGEEEWEQHEGSYEFEHHELAHELEADQFFGRIRRFVRRLPLAKIAKFAMPLVATAIGGPVGGVLGRVASQALGEEETAMHEWEQHEGAHEFEEELGAHEWELAGAHEFEEELGAHEWEHHEQAHEFEHHESAQEIAHEISQHEIAHHEALAEMMAEAASHEQHEAQAEAMMGAAVMTALSARDRRALQALLPNMVRGAALLTNILRRRRMTRPVVRAVPTIMRRTVATLKRRAAAGRPITRRAAGRVAAGQVRRVLGNPSACAAAIRQNVRVTRRMRARTAAR
jgi:hypothetical protein